MVNKDIYSYLSKDIHISANKDICMGLLTLYLYFRPVLSRHGYIYIHIYIKALYERNA